MTDDDLARRSVVPLVISAIVLFALAVPLTSVNLAVEGRGSDTTRLVPWFERLESYAMVVMVATVPLVALLARRRRAPTPRLLLMTAGQAVLVFFLAFPMMIVSRAGSFFGPTYVTSSAGPHGRRAHVYATGFIECRYGIYLEEGVRLSMRLVDQTRSCTVPTITWDERALPTISNR